MTNMHIPPGAQQTALSGAAQLGLGLGAQGINSPVSAGPFQNYPMRVTHIEVRRVQNGFVVMAFDFTQDHARFPNRDVAQLCYVAADAKELGAIMENFVNGTDMKWIPSMDIPITDFHTRRVVPNESNDYAKAAP